jgi:5'-nucleotidase
VSRNQLAIRTLFAAAVLLTVLLAGSLPPAAADSFFILLSNDDGYDAPGLRALSAAFQPGAEVVVAAPAEQQSGKGHSITTSYSPIFVSERKQPDGSLWYAIEAPPATCVRLAVESLLPRRPDLVISGINRGENLGITVYLSGTLGAAREAAIVGLPAIAVSMQGNREEDYAAAAAYVRELVGQLRAAGAVRPGLFLNVNVPAGERKGVRLARLSLRPTHESYERRTSPYGRVYFWSRWRPLEDDAEGTDVWAFQRGFITLTPMGLDVTDTGALQALQFLEQPAQPAPAR